MCLFSPVGIESLGAWGDVARAFIRQIGARIHKSTNDPRATSFLIQQISLDVQRGNVASVMVTLQSTKDWGAFGLLPAFYYFSPVNKDFLGFFFFLCLVVVPSL